MTTILLLAIGLIGIISAINSGLNQPRTGYPADLPKIYSDWVDELIKGRFKQGQQFLYSPNSDTYCCLGVLGSICGIPNDQLVNKSYFHTEDYMEKYHKIGFKYNPTDEKYIHKFPFELTKYTNENVICDTLANLNDVWSNNFHQIAQFILEHHKTIRTGKHISLNRR